MPKAYKIFNRLANGKLVSAGNIPNKMKFTFSKTKKNKPLIKHSEFFCFRTIKRARDFVLNVGTSSNQLEIWMVETGKLTKRKLLPPVWQYHCENPLALAKKFWTGDIFNTEDLFGASTDAYSTPHIKLVKKIS